MLTMPQRHSSVRRKYKSVGDHEKFFARVTRTLHYGKSDGSSLPVTELAAEIFSRAKNKLSLDLLDVEEAARLTRQASVSPCSLVLALLYLDRLKASNPKYLAKVPSSQLFLISMMIGSKFMQDDGQEDEVNNCEWAVYAGLTIQDINRAEKEFLNAIKWEVFVSDEAFWKRLEGMERLISLRQGCKRGWFSYTELDILLKSIHVAAILKTILHISLACAASYTATVFALMGTTMMVTQVPGLLSLVATRITQTTVPTTQLTVPEIDIPDIALHSDCHFDSIALSALSENRTENCSEYLENLENQNIMEDINKILPLWNGININIRSLWLANEGIDPSLSWAYAVKRYLIQDSFSVITPMS